MNVQKSGSGRSSQRRKKPMSEWYLGNEFFYFAVVDGRATEVDEFDDGRQLDLEIHVGMVDGRMACIGAELRTFSHATPKNRHSTVKPLRTQTAFLDITSPIWRSIPIASLTETAVARKQGQYRQMVDRYPQHKRLYDHLSGPESRKTRQRGPESPLTPGVLEIVGNAYGSARSRPVQAVRITLEESGFPGAGPSGEVTIDQARKAVQAARKAGIIPPASGKGRP